MSPVKWEGGGERPRRSLRARRDREPRHSMVREVGQSFYLMGLVAVVLSFYLGLGLLAVRLLG